MQRFVIDMKAGGNGDRHMGKGWAAPESTLCWMTGLESFLVMPHPRAASRYCLSLEVEPHVREGKLPRQVLIGAVNNVLVGVSELTMKTTVEWEVPPYAFELADDVVIRLIHPNAASPLEIAGLADDRILAVAVSRVRLDTFEIASVLSQKPPDGVKSEVSAGSKTDPALPPPLKSRYRVNDLTL